MGNSPTSQVASQHHQQHKSKVPNKTNNRHEFEDESDSYINDKIKLMPSEEESLPPNPITTSEIQGKITRFKESQKITYQNNVNEVFEITQKMDDLRELDAYAENAPENVLNSFPELVDYLNEPVQDHNEREQLLVRSFLVWLAKQFTDEQLEIESENPESLSSANTAEAQRKTPKIVIRYLREKKTTFATAIILLCWAAGIKCAKITGECRNSKTKEPVSCEWIAVLIKQSWQIIHPYRIIRALTGKIPEDFIMLDTDSEICSSETKEFIKTSFLNHYIMSSPEHFIYECFPDDSKWQLLPEPVSKDQFLDQECLYHPWWEMNLKLTSERKYRLIAGDGRIHIGFKGKNEFTSDLTLCYDLHIANSDLDSNVEHEYLQKMVYLVRTSPMWTPPFWDCDILLPSTGTYRIVFYAGHSPDLLLKICEFEIECEVCHPEPIPLPINPGVVGIGPGAALINCGLSNPSHRSGLINVGMSKKQVFKFRVDNKIAQKFKISGNLISSAETTTDNNINSERQLTHSIIVQNRAHKEAMISVSPPDNPGQYILEITTERVDGSESKIHTVCYYLLVYEVLENEETYPQMTEKKMLKEAMGSGDVTEILIRTQNCISKRIPGNDLDIQRARARAFVLKHKQNKQHKDKHRNMKADQRLQVLSIVQQVEYDTKLNDLIKHLKILTDYMNQTQSNDKSESKLLLDDSDLLENDSQAMHDAVDYLTEVVLTLFDKSSEKGKEPVHQIEDITNHLKNHGLVLKQEHIKQTTSVIEKYKKSQPAAVQKTFLASVYKSVHDAMSMMARN